MLEKAIEALTEAVTRQTDLLEKLAEGNKAVTPASSKATTTTASTADKPKPAGNKGASKKTPTEEDVKAVFGTNYLSKAKAKGDKERLIETMKPILDHFGVKQISKVEPENRAEAIGYGELLAAAFDEGGADAAEAVRFSFQSEDGDGEDAGEEDSPL